MNKNNVVKLKLANLAIVLSLIFSIFYASPALAKKNRYVALERVLSNNPELDLFINEKSQTIDLARTQNIRVRIKAKDLYNSIDRTASFKISVFENNGTERNFISSQQLSIFKGFKRSRVLSISAGEFSSPTKNLEFDIYDTAGNIINSYKTTISAINLASQVSGSTGINIADANCDGTTFGECQIDYLLQRVQFEAKPQRQASTRVVKTSDGLYKVTFPFPRNKFKFLGRKVRRKTKDNFGTGTGSGSGAGISDFGETLNISTINIGDSLSESQFITYGPNGDLIFNDNLFLDLEGKLGVGIQPPQAWLHVRNGDGLYPSVKIGQGPLTTVPVDGAIEYDGSDLYFTVGTTRSILGSGFGGGSNGGTTTYNNTTQIFNQGDVTYNDTFITNNNITEVYNQGNVIFNQTTLEYYDTIENYYNSTTTYKNGDITYDNGTVITFLNGSYMQDAYLNGTTTIDGALRILPLGTQYQVLTLINGNAIWRDSSAVFNGTTNHYSTTINNYNGDTNFFNQDITFVDNIHNYFNTTIYTTNNIEYHTNLDVTYVDIFEQYFNGVSNYNNQTVLYENSEITLNNTDLLFTNGSRLIIPGGVNGQVLTYVNGVAMWRDSLSTITNGNTVFENGDTIFRNGLVTFVNGDTVFRNGDVLFEDTEITLENTIITFRNGSYLEDPVLNGDIFFTDNSFTRINGTLQIAGGNLGEVLTSDANGIASWQAPTGQWTDIGNTLHPGDLGGQENVIIGGNTIATATIQLNSNGGAIFNKQNGVEDFVVENAAGQAFTIEGGNGNVTIATAGLTTADTLVLSDTTQSVTFSMLPAGSTVGPLFTASTLGLTVNGNSSLTVNVDGGSNELFVNGNTVSVGPTQGTATLNIDGNFALIGTSVQSITAAGGITADSSYVKVVGNAGPVVITANPQISVSGTLQDGQILILKGTDDVNSVTVIHGNGVTLESGVDFALQNKHILQLIYDADDSEWIEVTRSDN